MGSPEKPRRKIVYKLASLALPVLLLACNGTSNANFPNCGDNSQPKSTERIIGTKLLSTKSVKIGDLSLTTGNHSGEFNFHPLLKKPLGHDVYPIENGISYYRPKNWQEFPNYRKR